MDRWESSYYRPNISQQEIDDAEALLKNAPPGRLTFKDAETLMEGTWIHQRNTVMDSSLGKIKNQFNDYRWLDYVSLTTHSFILEN